MRQEAFEAETPPSAADPLLAINEHDSLGSRGVPGEAKRPDRRLPKLRLTSLDAFRGLTIAIMILVDDAGSAYPIIDHVPWNGIHLADFVMPFFLFIVGAAVTLSFRKFSILKLGDRGDLTQKAIWRSVKLFMWGIFLQGSMMPRMKYDVTDAYLVAGLNLGILQRIAFAYLVCCLIELYIPHSVPNRGDEDAYGPDPGVVELLSQYRLHWMACMSFLIAYIAIMVRTYVPSYQYTKASITGPVTYSVDCNIRGSFGPECNACGYWDRTVLTYSHMYNTPTYAGLSACRTTLPPQWCSVPFDPEGIVASLGTVPVVYIGIHYGRILTRVRSSSARIGHFLCIASLNTAIGLVLKVLWVDFNKNIWSPSYLFFTCGCAGFVFTFYYIVYDHDGMMPEEIKRQFAWLNRPYVWMGMNALLIFVFGASDLLTVLLQSVYYQKVEHNIVDEIYNNTLVSWSGPQVGLLLYTLGKIGFWFAAAYYLHRKKYYWKL